MPIAKTFAVASIALCVHVYIAESPFAAKPCCGISYQHGTPNIQRIFRLIFADSATHGDRRLEQASGLSEAGDIVWFGACMILAIRTAGKLISDHPTASDQEWESEVDTSIRLAHKVMVHLVTKHAALVRARTFLVSASR